MVGAFYLCHIIGDGSEEDPYRAYIANYPVNWVMTGKVGQGALVYVSNPIEALAFDNMIYKLSRNLDSTFSLSEWESLTETLRARGLSPEEYDPNRTVKEAIIWIGKVFDPAFDLDHFYVAP